MIGHDEEVARKNRQDEPEKNTLPREKTWPEQLITQVTYVQIVSISDTIFIGALHHNFSVLEHNIPISPPHLRELCQIAFRIRSESIIPNVATTSDPNTRLINATPMRFTGKWPRGRERCTEKYRRAPVEKSAKRHVRSYHIPKIRTRRARHIVTAPRGTPKGFVEVSTFKNWTRAIVHECLYYMHGRIIIAYQRQRKLQPSSFEHMLRMCVRMLNDPLPRCLD